MTSPSASFLEAYFVERSALIAELCLLPAEGDDPWSGCTAVAVPASETLSDQWVFLGQQRLREVLTVEGVSAPVPVRFERVVMVRQPLPRAGADLDRVQIGELVERHDRARAGLLGEAPPGGRLLERMHEVLGVPLSVSLHSQLTTDLGIDSLKLIQLRALLSEEFGVQIPDREVWAVHTLKDLFARVGDAAWSGQRGDYSWPRLLREPERGESLDTRFNLTRHGLHWAAAQFGMCAFTVGAKLAFQAELLHRERLPKRGSYLLCPTHQSLIDSPLLYAIFPYAVVHRFLILAYGPYFRQGALRAMVRMGRVILTGEANTILDSLQLAFQGTRRDYVVCLYPEGNCSYTGEIMRPRPGVGMLACETQVPIVPVVFQGSHKLLSPRSPGVRLARIRAIVGDPIYPPAPRRFERRDYDAVANDWYEAVRRLHAENPWPEEAP